MTVSSQNSQQFSTRMRSWVTRQFRRFSLVITVALNVVLLALILTRGLIVGYVSIGLGIALNVFVWLWRRSHGQSFFGQPKAAR